MTLSLERITDTLPIGFAELDADAKADGHDHLSRLAAAATPFTRFGHVNVLGFYLFPDCVYWFRFRPLCLPPPLLLLCAGKEIWWF
jgi:hypothetical protein